ncbi:MAG: tetratricopeptide repeat protein [Gammaproteobacteria bacterium]|nr:tetratricopeptide repeat protein [Gammaproteobacteria bacterium]MBU1777954.1 tetratricopeptide repeat protein [Gammaproteobacteria bacterium]MBU1968357.1 tetratricopeptide repeat protein [Gammaproteobacteria bacterium]
MSLINQMLNELEKRGENTVLGEAAIRAIPPRKSSNLRFYLLAVAALLLLLMAAKWYSGRGESVDAVPVTASNDAKFELVSGSADMTSLPVSVPASAGDIASMPQIEPPASKLSLELATTSSPGGLRASPAASESPVKSESPGAVVETIRKTPVQREAPAKIARSPSLAAKSQAIDPLKQISPRQHAENEFNKAALAAQQGNTDEAIAGYERALRLDPLHHAARRALVGVLLGVNRNADAEILLQEGLQRDSHESSFAMLLARMQVERDAIPLALETLEKTLPHADRQPEYHAFVAALLQRQNRHKEAITHYQIALQLAPGNGIWWMGAGISMQAVERVEDARDAYQRALAMQTLSAELTAYVQNKLTELGN